MRIIVTFAVQAEFAPWRRLWSFKRLEQSGPPVFAMRNGETEVFTVITGVAARGIQSQFSNLLMTADLCIVSGLAGSLRAPHAIGHVLAAKGIKQNRSEAILTSEDSLLRTAVHCGATPVDFFYTSDAIVNSVAEKARLGRVADAVEMETFQIMAKARQLGVPAVAVRAVSDTSDQNLPLDFNRAIDEDGSIDWLPALSQVAASPGCLPQLMRFGLESSRAARKLAHFLDQYLKCLMNEADLQLSSARMEIR